MTETPETQTYESMIAELKAIAKQLDDPETPIEEAVRLHQRGLALILANSRTDDHGSSARRVTIISSSFCNFSISSRGS